MMTLFSSDRRHPKVDELLPIRTVAIFDFPLAARAPRRLNRRKGAARGRGGGGGLSMSRAARDAHGLARVAAAVRGRRAAPRSARADPVHLLTVAACFLLAFSERRRGGSARTLGALAGFRASLPLSRRVPAARGGGLFRCALS